MRLAHQSFEYCAGTRHPPFCLDRPNFSTPPMEWSIRNHVTDRGCNQTKNHHKTLKSSQASYNVDGKRTMEEEAESRAKLELLKTAEHQSKTIGLKELWERCLCTLSVPFQYGHGAKTSITRHDAGERRHENVAGTLLSEHLLDLLPSLTASVHEPSIIFIQNGRIHPHRHFYTLLYYPISIVTIPI